MCGRLFVWVCKSIVQRVPEVVSSILTGSCGVAVILMLSLPLLARRYELQQQRRKPQIVLIIGFLAGFLVLERLAPDLLEQAIKSILRKPRLATTWRLPGRALWQLRLPSAG